MDFTTRSAALDACRDIPIRDISVDNVMPIVTRCKEIGILESVAVDIINAMFRRYNVHRGSYRPTFDITHLEIFDYIRDNVNMDIFDSVKFGHYIETMSQGEMMVIFWFLFNGFELHLSTIRGTPIQFSCTSIPDGTMTKSMINTYSLYTTVKKTASPTIEKRNEIVLFFVFI